MIPILHGPHFDQLFRANVILSARAPRYVVNGFSGPLSIKTVVRGEAIWRVAGVRYRVDRTACLVVDHHEPYDMVIDASEPVETFIIFFADGLANDVAAARLRSIETLLDDPAPCEPNVLPIARRLWAEGTPLLEAVGRMRHVAANDTLLLDIHLRAMVDHFADLLVQVKSERDRIAATKPATRAELHRRVLRGRAAIEEMIARPFDLETAAAEAFLSPHHFHRTFSAAFCEAPHAYVERRRLARARRFLEETDAPITEICSAVGYESVPSFTTMFHRRIGTPPTAYRRKFRKE